MANKTYKDKAAASHGVDGGKYAPKEASGTYGTPIDVPYLMSINLPATWEQYTRYADNRRILDIPSDQGREGTFVTAARDFALEEQLGYFSKDIAGGGLVEVQANTLKKGAFYYEVQNKFEDGTAYAAKFWLYNVTIGKPEMAAATDTNTISPNDWNYPITVLGDSVKTTDGAEEYKDENGFKKVVRVYMSIPGDTNYNTFGDTVPTLKYEAPTP